VKSGKHPEKALTAVRVRSLNVPGRYADGNGLYLVVEPSGAKRWLLRIVVQGRRRDIGLGGLSLVSLAEAREKALVYRKLAREGGDPLAERQKVEIVIPTFAEAAEAVHAEHKASWKNEKHSGQWISTLTTYALPLIGEKKIDQINTPDILKVLSPIWLTKPETARRVRQRLGTVFDWAKAAGHRTGENPIEGVAKGLPKQPEKKNHHEALPYADVPAFIAELRGLESDEIVRLAFEFLILTASRTGEVVGSRWSEIDEAQKLWIIPADRMKAGREHRVPLVTRALELLKQTKLLSAESDYVFPGRNYDKPISNMAFLMLIRRLKRTTTAHGFRSSFRDWASEATNFPREVAEQALAHAVENKVEAAYRRGDLLEKRREMMIVWAAFCESGK